jgi:hypothetical protein
LEYPLVFCSTSNVLETVDITHIFCLQNAYSLFCDVFCI